MKTKQSSDKTIDKENSEIVWLTTFCEENDIALMTMRYMITKGNGVKTFKIGRRRYLTRKEGREWISKIQREYVESSISISS